MKKTRWTLWVKLTKDTPATHIGQRSRSYTGHEITQHVVLWWYTNVPNLVCLYMSRNKFKTIMQIHGENNYNIDVEVKDQGHTEAMNHVIHRRPIWFTFYRKSCQNSNKFVLEVSGQCRIGITNICNTYTHLPNMVNVKAKKIMGRTRRHIKITINLTFRSKVNVVSGSWTYAKFEHFGSYELLIDSTFECLTARL